MRRCARALWRWSWLPSLSVLAACLLFLAAVERRFDTFGIRRSTEPFSFGLAYFGRELQDRELHRLWLGVVGGEAGEEFDEVGLEVAAAELARLDADLPYSGRKSVPARLVMDGRTASAKVRYRGDTYAHWGRAKKSFRVEVRKEDAFAGRRHFNLIAAKFPEQLNNYLSYVLARKLGLLAPRVKLVRVQLNGDYHGLYELTEQVDESLLRSNDRMPGDVYRGEVLFETAWSGLPLDLFTRAGVWDKVAVDIRRPAEANAPLCVLLEALQMPASPMASERVMALLDLEQMARLSAFEVLAQGHHNDHFHNWRLYWDPWRGRFEPIVWDPVGWQENTRPKDCGAVDLHPVYTPLHLALHRSAAFLVRRQEILAAWLRDGSRAFVAEAVDVLRRIRPPLRCDPNVDPINTAVRERALDDLAAFVPRVAADVERFVLQDQLRCRFTAGGPGQLRLSLQSERVARGLRVRFDGPVAPQGVTVRAPDGVAVELGGGWRAEGSEVVIEIPLPSALEPRLRWRPESHDLRNVGMVPVRTAYEFDFAGTGDRRVIGVSADGEQATAGDEEASAFPAIRAMYGADLLWPRARRTRTFSGRVPIAGVERVRDDVEIAPGTVFAMAAGASLLFEGRVTAIGTAEQTIRVEPAEGKAWGVVALDGSGCTGSRLEHWHFAGGSTHVEALRQYSAMLSVHAAREVVLRDCTFTDPRGPDDVVHLVRSGVSLERMALLASNGDGLDVDLCSVVLRDCRVTDCVGDGVDLMGSQAVIESSAMLRCRDKGLSVGEGSIAVAVRCTIADCVTGAAVKEASAAHLLHCALGTCETGLIATQEDWRYAGSGVVHVHRSDLGQPVLVAPTGRIHIRDSRCGNAQSANVAVEHCSERREIEAGPVPLPTGLGELAEVAAQAWAVQGPVRGPGGGR